MLSFQNIHTQPCKESSKPIHINRRHTCLTVTSQMSILYIPIDIVLQHSKINVCMFNSKRNCYYTTKKIITLDTQAYLELKATRLDMPLWEILFPSLYLVVIQCIVRRETSNCENPRCMLQENGHLDKVTSSHQLPMWGALYHIPPFIWIPQAMHIFDNIYLCMPL